MTHLAGQTIPFVSETSRVVQKTQLQWTLVIVNSDLSPILFTNERFSLLPESMIFSFIAYNKPGTLIADLVDS